MWCCGSDKSKRMEQQVLAVEQVLVAEQIEQAPSGRVRQGPPDAVQFVRIAAAIHVTIW